MSRPTQSLRSPLPLLAAGILAALLLIAIMTLPPKPAGVDASKVETLSQGEAITIVAQAMRSGDAAVRVATQGQARFNDGSWYISVGDAQFRFSQRNRIVVAENDAAKQLQFSDSPGR